MTTTGIDEAWARAPISALNANGYRFVVRYLSYDTTGKNLTHDEARALSAAGLSIVSNWEFAAQAARKGRAQGVRDAKEAARQHAACGGPATRPVYFSVDFDAPDFAPGSHDPVAKLGPIADYFRGVASVLGLPRVGAYGGFWVIKRLFDAGLIRWGWQTFAWSGGRWDARAQLRQVHNGVKVGGADVDIDRAQVPDFGQWATDGATIPPDPGTLAVDGVLGPLTVRRWQQIMGTHVDGVIDQPPKPSSLVMAVQRHLNTAIDARLVVDGLGIDQDGHTVYQTTRALQRYLGTSQDGVLSLPASECVMALQRRLNGGRF